MEWLKLKETIVERARASGRDPQAIQLVAVTKGRSVVEIKTLYNQGIRDFGESKVQEVEAKRVHLPEDIRWHMIGTIQTKKVPKIVGSYFLIHSVDSLELAEKISSVSMQRGLITSLLLQVNVSGEVTKHGFRPDELRSCFATLKALPNIVLKGLMTMAPDTENLVLIRQTFHGLKALQEELMPLSELSMGMSHDFEIAIDEGATLLRIGTLLFQP